MQSSKKGNEFVKRLATAGAVWAVAKALEPPMLARRTRKIDRSIAATAAKAGTSFEHAGKNVRQHVGLLLAGIGCRLSVIGYRLSVYSDNR